MMAAVACVLGFAFVYQLVALPLYTFDGVGPDFVLGAVCALSVYGRPGAALLAAALGGIIVDFVSLDPWSAHALAYLAAGWMLVRARARGWLADVPSCGVLIFAASVAAIGVRSSIVFIHDGRAVLPAWSALLLAALYSGGVGCLVVGLSSPFREQLLGPRRRSEFHRVIPPE